MMFAEVLGKGFCWTEKTHPKLALSCLRVLGKASTRQKMEIHLLGSWTQSMLHMRAWKLSWEPAIVGLPYVVLGRWHPTSCRSCLPGSTLSSASPGQTAWSRNAGCCVSLLPWERGEARG